MTDPARAERHGAWRTQDECAFIDRMGLHAELLRGYSRTQLLASFWLACAQRAKWGHMDRATVMAHLEGARRNG